MPKRSRFRGLFHKQNGKRAQALLRSASHQFCDVHWSLPSQLSWKKSFLLTYKILGLLLNTLAANENYPVLHRDNLTIPIQMQSSQRKKSFSPFFAAFLKCSWNFKSFEKKDGSHNLCISKITDSKKVVRWMPTK